MIKIDRGVKEKYPELYLGIRVIVAEVREKGYDYYKEIEKFKERIKFNLENIKDHPTIRALRDFYWKIGLDPTKIRPSSEALLRRFLRDNTIPRINNVVDAGNIASLETLIPIGLYDLVKTKGEINLRFSKEGEEFLDISGKSKILKDGLIVLADEEGVIHLFPHRDSMRTRITKDTKRILIVACGVRGIDNSLVDKAAYRVIELLKS
ncbi:MAG: phenylalanine--tRNA ligase beta subunit-related protein [Nitrososphaerales archaeon]